MAMLLNALTLNEYFHGLPVPGASGLSSGTLNSFSALLPLGKSIQRCYRFTVSFFAPDMTKNVELFNRVGPMPLLRPFHVRGLSIPQYTFEKETQFYGPAPRSFPVLRHDGFEIKIDFEEDERGTIGSFINWLQRLALEPKNGLYTPPDFVKLPLIGVVAESDIGVPIAVYSLHDAFYLSASGPDFDYGENTAIKYGITFNVDIINSFFPQSALFSQLTQIFL